MSHCYPGVPKTLYFVQVLENFMAYETLTRHDLRNLEHAAYDRILGHYRV